VHLGAEEAEPAISGKRRYSGEEEEEEQDIQEMPMDFGFEDAKVPGSNREREALGVVE
jgi:hypothetical protein